MDTFRHEVDFQTKYKPGDKFMEAATPGSGIPGTIIDFNGKNALRWIPPAGMGFSWMSYFKLWKNLGETGGHITLKQRVAGLTTERSYAAFGLMKYNVAYYGYAMLKVWNGRFYAGLFANDQDAQRWSNALLQVDCGPADSGEHDWVVVISKTAIMFQFDEITGSADIPPGRQGSVLDGARVYCPMAVVTAHAVVCEE